MTLFFEWGNSVLLNLFKRVVHFSLKKKNEFLSYISKTAFLRYFRSKFYGASVETIVYTYTFYSLLNIFSCLIAHILFWCYGRDLVQDFCHSPRCPKYKSATLEMFEFGHICRLWQCPPNIFFFTKTQIKGLCGFHMYTPTFLQDPMLESSLWLIQ